MRPGIRSSDADDKAQSLAGIVNLDAAGFQREEPGIKGTCKRGETKSYTDYYVNLRTNMPACIIELWFYEQPDDNQLFDANSADSYAKANQDAVY